jgi:hypothetical protein
MGGDDGADGTALYAGPMRPRPLLAGALACLVLLSACASQSGDSSTSATTTTTKPHHAPQGPGCRFIVAGTGARSTPPGDKLLFLQDAVAQATTCYDKITFVFDKGDGPDLPPGYTVEYKKPPFLEGVHTSTEGFKEARYVLYIEFRPVSTNDTRFPGRVRQTYKGNLRLGLKSMRHTVIVEWLKDAPPSLNATTNTTTTTKSAPATTTTTRAKQKGKGGSTSTTTTTLAPATTVPAPLPGPTTTTTLPLNDPATSRVVWLIGLDSKRPFTVDASNQPPQVSIIIMH